MDFTTKTKPKTPQKWSKFDLKHLKMIWSHHGFGVPLFLGPPHLNFGEISPEKCRNVCPAVELAGGRESQDAAETSVWGKPITNKHGYLMKIHENTWRFIGTWWGSSEDTVLEHTWTYLNNSLIFKEFCEVVEVVFVDRVGQVDCLAAFFLKTDVYCICTAQCYSLRHENLVLWVKHMERTTENNCRLSCCAKERPWKTMTNSVLS